MGFFDLRGALAALAAARFFGLAAGAAAFGGSSARRKRPARGAGVDQPHGLVERNGLRRLLVRQVGVDAVVADVRPIAAVLGDDHAALLGMVAKLLARVGAEAAALAGVELLLLDQRDGAIEADRQDVFAGVD